MGEQDIESLFRIYGEVKKIIKEKSLPFSFKVDTGRYDTAIEFVDGTPFHPPVSKDWSTKPIILCPDLLEWHYKIIIEYEEEVGQRKPGASLARKGHHRKGDLDNKRDSKRKRYYNGAHFTTLRIWESEKNWKQKLEKFLLSIPTEHHS